MITKATLSILGLYRYDPTIFSEMWLPAVITDKGDEHLVYEQILLEYAELEVLYPDPAVTRSSTSREMNAERSPRRGTSKVQAKLKTRSAPGTTRPTPTARRPERPRPIPAQ